MANMQERLETAIERTETDSSLFHNVVHGPDTDTVTTENGQVPTVAKALKDVRNELYGQASSLVNMAQAAADDAAHSVQLARVEVQNAQAEVQNAHAEVVKASQEVDKAKAEVVNAKAEVVNAQTEVQNAAAEVVKAKAEVTNAKAEVQNAKAEVQNAKNEVTKAHIWAEGTDAEVASQGGIHSCKEWVDLARQATVGSFPVSVAGVAVANQSELPLNLTVPLNDIDQVLSVLVENTALLPETYHLSTSGNSVILHNPLAKDERWCVKCLYDVQSLNTVVDCVFYEDM